MAVKPIYAAIYAVYKGDELLGIGTAEELSKLLGMKPVTIRWYTRPQRQEEDPQERDLGR